KIDQDWQQCGPLIESGRAYPSDRKKTKKTAESCYLILARPAA
ncbi:MAG: hypothetical protein ACI861_002349, partial [Paracoccaceae bacterium]